MNLVLCTMDAEGDHVLSLHRGSVGTDFLRWAQSVQKLWHVMDNTHLLPKKENSTLTLFFGIQEYFFFQVEIPT